MMRLTNVLISALALGLCLSAPVAQSNNKSLSAASGSTITGRVVARGKALEGAVITVWQGYDEPTPSTTAAKGRTDADGNYELTNVSPGNYYISATAAGFVTGKENKFPANLRLLIIVGCNAIDPINFELLPEGVIKGAVTDAAGKPVARAPITVFPESLPADVGPRRYARDLSTDDQGTYKVSGIPAGRYRIAAGYQPVAYATLSGRVGYRRVFYSDANDEASAKVIEISEGSEVTNVNINLGHPVKTFSVSARIVDSQNGKPVEDIDYGLDVFSNGKRIGGAHPRGRSNSRGEITIDNVPPGEYSIRVPGGSGLWPAGEIPPAPNIFGESKRFEVADKDVSEIEIRVVRAATVSGFVVIEGSVGMDILAKVPQMHIVALVMPKPGGANPIMRTNIKPDGSFVFRGLLPGKLQFNFDAPSVGGRMPLRLVRTERDGVRLDSDPEIVAGDQITGLRVVLGYANSSIHGIVKLDNGPLPPGVVGRAVVLQYGKLVDSASLDPHGEFRFQHLSAGGYTLAVFAHGANSPEWKAEQQLTIPDDKVSEVTMLLESTPSRPRPPSPRPLVPR
jgi:hypothetical protein